jgi:hypothetical protein
MMQLKVFLLITDETTAAMAAAEAAAATEAVAVVTAVAAAVAAMGAAGRNVPFLVSTVQYTLPGTRHGYFNHCFGSGSGLNQVSGSGFGSGSRRA